MRRFKSIFKGGLCLGLTFALMLSGTACGKEESLAYPESGSEEVKTEVRSLKEIIGDNISENGSITVGGYNVNYDLNYTVPDVKQVYTYEGSFLENDPEIEKKIVSDFFGGTEKKLDEIKYVNDADFIPLLYKYRNILMFQELGTTSLSSEALTQELYDEYMSNIDSSFKKVYTWVDETSYYIHMYEGEYNGNRYGMIYSYDSANLKRNIYVSPISLTEYFPDFDAKTMFVVDNQYNSESGNMCSMSEENIKEDATDVIAKLGLENDDIFLTVDPNMYISRDGSPNKTVGEIPYTGIPKLVFAEAGIMAANSSLNKDNQAVNLFEYKVLKEAEQKPSQNADDVNIAENGYAVYLCSEPFSENVKPTVKSSFNQGCIYYTDKGLYSVDISTIAKIDNLVDNVQLMTFDKIKESFQDALETNPEIAPESSGSLKVTNVDFTYVLIEDKENSGKATYVPAWYFTIQDNKLKTGTDAVTYTCVIDARDGSVLNGSMK